MSLVDLFGHGEHRRNLGHFASIASIAKADGNVSEKEEKILTLFARKLDITDEEYTKILKTDKQFPIEPPTTSERRLERLFDLFRVVFIDHSIDEHELSLIKRYALGLGFTEDAIEPIIKRSLAIFSGNIEFEDYQYLVKN